MKKYRGIVVLLLVLGIAPAVFAAAGVTGKVHMDQTAYKLRAKMTVVHEIENNGTSTVTYQNVANRTFTYAIFSVPYDPTRTRGGNLEETGAQYIVPGQTDSFAAGTISLQGLPAGLYRIFVFAPGFTGGASSVSAGTSFRIVPNAEAGTIEP